MDNFALDMLLAYLSRTLLRQKPTVWRLLFSAAVGTALVFPYLFVEPIWARILYKIAVLLAVSLPLSDTLRLLRKTLVVYAALSAAFGGLFYLVTNTDVLFSGGALVSSGGVVAAVAGSILLGLYLLRQVKGIVKEHLNKRHSVRVQLVEGERYLFVNGFYDSGNTVQASDGKGVIFLSPAVRDKIGALVPKDSVVVKTVQGATVFELYQIECVKIYSGGNVNTIQRVNVAYSRDNLSGCDALLPYNL